MGNGIADRLNQQKPSLMSRGSQLPPPIASWWVDELRGLLGPFLKKAVQRQQQVANSNILPKWRIPLIQCK